MSVLTPSLNQRRFLADAIRSIREQDYPRIEHVVADGGSTDGTLELLREFPEIRWSAEPDSGQSDALLKALAASRGEVIGWLNADDRYLPGAVSRAVAALRANPHCGMVYSNYVDIEEDGRERTRNHVGPFSLERQINDGNIVPQPTVFMRREALAHVGFVDPAYHYAMDYELWIRIGRAFAVLYVDDYWAEFRLHPESKSSALVSGFWPEERAISRRYGGKLLSGLLLRHVNRSHPRLGRWLLRGRRALNLARGRA